MERIYFLLTGDGPELEAVKEEVQHVKEALTAWNVFVAKYAKGREYLHSHSFIGISFSYGDPKPEGWCKAENRCGIYRPKATTCPEAYKEWKSLPRLPYWDSLNRTLGVSDVIKPSSRGMRMLGLAYKNSEEGFVLSCPIADDGTYYTPKGPCEELTTTRYIELTKKEA